MREFGGFEIPRILLPAQIARLGLTPARIRTELRRGNWQRLAVGVLLTRPDEPTRDDWAHVGVHLAGRSSALTGWDAVRVRGLGARNPPDSTVLVVTRRGANRVVGGVRIRRTSRPFARSTLPADHPTLSLVPIVAVERAIADTALACTDLESVRALVTAAVQRRNVILSDIVAELDAGPRNRSRLLRAALADATDGARSAAEAAAVGRLSRSAVPPFELNVPIVDERGSVLYVVDILWRDLRAALEIDSREFHFSESDWHTTLARHSELTRCGLAVTHYPPSAVTTGSNHWLNEVQEWLRRRADELGVPYPGGRGVVAPAVGATPPPFVVTSGVRARHLP